MLEDRLYPRLLKQHAERQSERARKGVPYVQDLGPGGQRRGGRNGLSLCSIRGRLLHGRLTRTRLLIRDGRRLLGFRRRIHARSSRVRGSGGRRRRGGSRWLHGSASAPQQKSCKEQAKRLHFPHTLARAPAVILAGAGCVLIPVSVGWSTARDLSMLRPMNTRTFPSLPKLGRGTAVLLLAGLVSLNACKAHTTPEPEPEAAQPATAAAENKPSVEQKQPSRPEPKMIPAPA